MVQRNLSAAEQPEKVAERLGASSHVGIGAIGRCDLREIWAMPVDLVDLFGVGFSVITYFCNAPVNNVRVERRSPLNDMPLEVRLVGFDLAGTHDNVDLYDLRFEIQDDVILLIADDQSLIAVGDADPMSLLEFTAQHSLALLELPMAVFARELVAA